MNILIPGGCGYIGAWLIPHLLADGHKVTVYDTQWFGHGHLPDNGSLTVIVDDVREPDYPKEDFDAVIYLASISSDEMCQRNPQLAHAVNELAPMAWATLARLRGVSRFIYASSVAVYGVSDANETSPVAPTTIYAKGKVAAERSILNDSAFPDAIIVRSASVCGYSPHQRFDLTVNKMVHDAVRKGVITVNGGDQKRSHIHIKDICDFYKLLLKAPVNMIAGQIFNAVAENQAVVDTAWIVEDEIKCPVKIKERTDNRSYTVDGSKALDVLGFAPKRRVVDAVRDLKMHFDGGEWKDSFTNPVYMNIADGLS